MNAPAPDPNAPFWLVALAIATAFVTFVDIALRWIAPRTKNTVDDEALSWVQRALAWLKKLNPLGVLAVVALGAVVASTLACRTAGPIADHAIDNAPTIDCTILDGSKLDLAQGAIEHVLAEKPGDWMAAAHAAAAYGAALGGCGLAKLVQEALTRRGSTIEQWKAHDALEHFRATVAGGATFHTAEGDL